MNGYTGQCGCQQLCYRKEEKRGRYCKILIVGKSWRGIVMRKIKDTLSDVERLSHILRGGCYPQRSNILGVGSGNFYQAAMNSILALRGMRKKTKQNAQKWAFHDARIQIFIKTI